MRQLFLNKGNLVIKEVAQPLLHESSLLVAIHYTYITFHTDIYAAGKSTEGFLSSMPHKVKRMLEAGLHEQSELQQTYLTGGGYSCVGQVISVGRQITKYAPGDFVACLDKQYDYRTDVVCIPEQYAVKISDKKKIIQAPLIPFAADALQALQRAHVCIGELIGVFGLDVNGLLMVQLAKVAGCSVIAIDTDQHRLDMAMNMGATYALHIDRDDIHKEIRLITEQYSLDTIFLTNEDPVFFDHAITAIRKKGKLVLFGDCIRALHQTTEIGDTNIIIVRNSFTSHDMALQWSDNNNMRTCLSLMEKDILSFKALIEDHVSVKKVTQAYQRLQKKLSVGVLISYEQTESTHKTQMPAEQSSIPTDIPRYVPAITDNIHVGFIGMSDFSNTVIAPHIAKMRNVVIKGIFEEDTRKLNTALHKYSTAKLCAKQEIFSTALCDVVIIATSHVSHAEYALQALQNGKAVFLEKPMVTDFNQLQKISTYLQEHKDSLFAVGYNYSFSPFAKKIKKVVQKRKTPLMAHYRINRELMQSERRMPHAMGAGRIIGDMCQVVDLLCYFADMAPISVSVESMHASRDDIFPTDNVSAQIAFADGSVCSFLYTTLGHSDMGSDRLEMYFDGKVILMEDYMELYGFGVSSWFNETLPTPDRGCQAMVSQFFKTLYNQDSNPLISFDHLLQVAQLTLIIDQLACEGGGKKEL
jgi:predicted dehydrogenase/threonine dehydrogenase-like Zn-dependent dehydrogenase